MAGRNAGGGFRGGGGRGMGGSRGFSGGSRSSRSGLGSSRGSSGGLGGSSRGSSGHSMGSRGSSGRSLSSSGPNRHTSSSGSSHRTTGNSGGFRGGFGGGPIGGHHHRPFFYPFGPRGLYHRPFGIRPRRSAFGCLPSIMFIPFSLFIVFFIIFSMGNNSSNSNQNIDATITSNTVKREPLEKGAVVETNYYEDKLGWISNKTTLITGLKNFYNLTGIQPYILLIDSIGDNPTDNEIDVFANKYYDEHFTDEAHLLFMYIEDIDYMYGIVGSRGLTIMDQEAWDILYDYVENYWHSDLEEEDMFATAFTKAGERIMSDPNAATKMKTSVFKVLIIVVAIIIIISILRKWQKDRTLQKQQEDENLKEILNTPLEKFGSKEMEDLIDKYEKDNTDDL